ncbi:uncharacterized protein LOC119682711 [Teleopsis dalmanni]|uniref:uncharacterized protein LOC119682711 n=1 Tax=Teleopsis dalmanni TaxID=139649 RepID=UPI0018CE98BC|nr:uncharacterized protein LOC119682711 [Teleopsis dalmanni]
MKSTPYVSPAHAPLASMPLPAATSFTTSLPITISPSSLSSTVAPTASEMESDVSSLLTSWASLSMNSSTLPKNRRKIKRRPEKIQNGVKNFVSSLVNTLKEDILHLFFKSKAITVRKYNLTIKKFTKEIYDMEKIYLLYNFIGYWQWQHIIVCKSANNKFQVLGVIISLLFLHISPL